MFNSKKKFFKQKVKEVTYRIWDLEFKIEKSSQVREGVRQDRDKLLDAQNRLQVTFKQKPDDEKTKKELEAVVDTIKRYEAQMKMIDVEIYGKKAEGEDPGSNGLVDTIDSLAELKQMYISYIKKL